MACLGWAWWRAESAGENGSSVRLDAVGGEVERGSRRSPLQLLADRHCPQPAELLEAQIVRAAAQQPHRTLRRGPANVAGTAAFLAERWGESVAAVQQQMEDNFAAVFGEAP